MRVLTVMSVVFMPLTFIVGLYGMNFDAPAFHWRHGYLIVWLILIGLFIGVIRWFSARGGCVRQPTSPPATHRRWPTV